MSRAKHDQRGMSGERDMVEQESIVHALSGSKKRTAG